VIDERPTSRRLGRVLVLWTAVVAGLGFVAGLVGFVFSTMLWWDESYTPPACFELADDYNPVLAAIALGSGPVLASAALLGALTKRDDGARPKETVGSCLIGTGIAVTITAPLFAYVLIDLAYRVGVRSNYDFADREACVSQLMSGVLAWSLVVVIVIGLFALGRTMVRYR